MKFRFLLVCTIFLSACGGHYEATQPVLMASTQGKSGLVQVSAPPANLQLPSYYTKYVDASGIPIVAKGTVADAALLKMKTIVDTMVGRDPYVRQQLISRLRRVLLIPKADGMTSLPEYANLDQTNPIPGTTWNARAQGVGWTSALPYMSCSEANLLHSGWPQDRYTDESICIHEFAHTVWDAGIAFRDTAAPARLTAAYNTAINRGLLGSSYASASVSEYWAEGVQAWFNAAACSNKHTPTCTNQALYQYDYSLWYEVGHWFPAPYQLTTQLYP